MNRRGFTLVEVLIATAVLGFSLVVMLGFHAQAIRSNREARKITECTYLAQRQMEELLALEWTQAGGRPDDLTDGVALGSGNDWDPLFHPASGGWPDPVNARGETVSNEDEAQPMYYVTWDVESMDAVDDSWIRIRVRCAYEDAAFDTWHGTTLSTFKYRDG